MATAIPKIGQRGTQNSSNALESINANICISSKIVCSEYLGPENQPIDFYTVNTTPDSLNPKGYVSQMRIDNSGNIGFFGIPIAEVFRDVNDTSCNILYYNKIIEINVAATLPSSAVGNLRVEVYFGQWPVQPVGIASKILCSASSSVGTGYGCVGYVVNRNIFPGPNFIFFNTNTTGLTITNGVASIGGPVQPYAMRYSFTPTNKPNLMTCFIRQIQSVYNKQVIGVRGYYL